jgi:uncharacterized coiled-coil DUF342 family protein
MKVLLLHNTMAFTEGTKKRMKALQEGKVAKELNTKVSTTEIYNEVKELRDEVRSLHEALSELRLLVMDLAEVVSG